MDKELKELLNELNKTLGKFMDNTSDHLEETVSDALEEAHKEKCHLAIKKNKNGKAEVLMEGTTLAILITLAGLEKTVLEKTHVPNNVWEMIKQTVGTKEGD